MLTAETTTKCFVSIALCGSKFEITMKGMDRKSQFLEGKQQADAIGPATERNGKESALGRNPGLSKSMPDVF